ncbi:MAG: heterodisulfide reductase subunit B [Actinobacteria bacterium HGW-Actinobacteria-7]|nr:MAG: heterodisulfide reductase subunit B [Actinobacteria bacterium HGW-Actinobacteria-7]
MSLGYYPGCSLHGTAREFDESMRAVTDALDIEMTEIDNWSCCGASSAHSASHLLGVALAARNLALAEAEGRDAVVAPCAACFSRLATARHELLENEELAASLPDILERPFENTVEVLNVVQLLLEYDERIRERVAQSPVFSAVGQMKVAAYYGCLLVRPVGVAGADDIEVPTTMEQVATACGAQPVTWNMAVECCGGSLSMSRTSSVVRLGRAIIDDARRAGADALLVACPMCHANLDFRQVARTEDGDALPVLYLTQLVGLALGIDPETLGMHRHFVDTSPLMAELAERAKAAEAAATAKASARNGSVV